MENDDYEEVYVEGESFDEEEDYEVIEISLTENEINYWISKLEELRERKDGHVHLELDDESELIIHYDEDELSDEDDGEVTE